MPSGKVHDKVSFALLPLVAGGSYYITNDIKQTGILSVSYIFSALMFSGDLDIRSKQTNRWKFLKFIWIPYKKMFRHRSKFTHGVVLGTIIRVLYLTAVIIGFLILGNLFSNFIFGKEVVDIKMFIENSKNIIIENSQIVLTIFIGLMIGSLSHSLTDFLHSAFRR